MHFYILKSMKSMLYLKIAILERKSELEHFVQQAKKLKRNGNFFSFQAENFGVYHMVREF